jgi:hypothetical protein
MGKSCFLVAWVLLLASYLAGQTPLLGEYNFSQMGYTILVIPSSGFGITDPSKEDVIAYFDERLGLETLQTQLVGHRDAVIYPFMCMESHFIQVCKAGRSLETLAVSRNCHSISASEGEFAHEGYIPFQGYKIARRQVDTFPNPEAARLGRASLLQLPGLIVVPDPQWLVYDGEFGFYRENVQATADEVLADVEEKLHKRFPDEPFALEVHQNSSNAQGSTYRVLVRCRQALFDGFNLYKVDWGGWKPYLLRLESYWRAGY